jgi:hypothetical protein
LVGRPEGRRPLGRPRHRWEDNIKMDLQEVTWGVMDWIEICGLLWYYAASCGNCLPTFRDNLSVTSSRVKSPSRKAA